MTIPASQLPSPRAERLYLQYMRARNRAIQRAVRPLWARAVAEFARRREKDLDRREDAATRRMDAEPDSDWIAPLIRASSATLAIIEARFPPNTAVLSAVAAVAWPHSTRGAAEQVVMSTQGRRAQRAALNRVRLFATESQEDIARSWVRDNVALITRMDQDLKSAMERMILGDIRRGSGIDTIARNIQRRFQVSESRSRLIARDQSAKFNAQVHQGSFEVVGDEEYIWSTSDDQRVRDEHEALDGTIQRWDDPPVTNLNGDRNHPGEDYQCRCVALRVPRGRSRTAAPNFAP